MTKNREAEFSLENPKSTITQLCRDSYYGDIVDLDIFKNISTKLLVLPVTDDEIVGPLLLPLIPIQLGMSDKGSRLVVSIQRETGLVSPREEDTLLQVSSVFLKSEGGKIILPDVVNSGGTKFDSAHKPDVIDFGKVGGASFEFHLESKRESSNYELLVGDKNIKIRLLMKWHYHPFVFMDMRPGFSSCSNKFKSLKESHLSMKDLTGTWKGGKVDAAKPAVPMTVTDPTTHATYNISDPGSKEVDRTWALTLERDGRFSYVDPGGVLGLEQSRGTWKFSAPNQIVFMPDTKESKTIVWKILRFDKSPEMLVETRGPSGSMFLIRGT